MSDLSTTSRVPAARNEPRAAARVDATPTDELTLMSSALPLHTHSVAGLHPPTAASATDIASSRCPTDMREPRRPAEPGCRLPPAGCRLPPVHAAAVAGRQRSTLMRWWLAAGNYAPAPTERCDTVHTWLQHHLAERLQAARGGRHPPLLAEAYAALAGAMNSYELCRCAPTPLPLPWLPYTCSCSSQWCCNMVMVTQSKTVIIIVSMMVLVCSFPLCCFVIHVVIFAGC